MKVFFTLCLALLTSMLAICQSSPGLEFINPQLVSGIANKQGAVYRFANIAPDVDAEIKVKKVSRNDLVIANIDNSVLGWNKAFQPEFGLPGLVLPNQNWYIDFELSFFKAGTNQLRIMDTVDLTALDVDGDGNSISEYVTYDRPSSILYSTFTFLSSAASGVLGQSFECGEDGIASTLINCPACNGTGLTNSGSGNNNECQTCDGSGKLHSACGHPYEGGTGSTVNGPVNNFVNIDTAATQVMATYQFLNMSKIKFRYGAKSGALSSNGSGIRLNSTWFRKFSLKPVTTLPVKLESFTATLNTNKKAELKWTTSSEVNTSRFVIERSTDGKTFGDAGSVLAAGNSSGKNYYTFSDNLTELKSTIVYYRLQSIDQDGDMEYSATRIIHLGPESAKAISLLTYPNPVSNEVRVTLPAAWQNKKITYELRTVNGQLTRRIESAASDQTETLGTKGLKPGIYLLSVSCNGQRLHQKIVKN